MAKNNDAQTDPIIETHGRLSPEKIISLVGKERIVDRLKFLERVYNTFVDRWPGMYLNPYLLRETVESYFCDVYRLKFFRPVNFVDEPKQAAYTIKWISWIRPIQMYEGTGPCPSTIMSNAYYALMAGLALLGINLDTKNDAWWASYVTNAVYILHFHSISIESLNQEMYVLQALARAIPDKR
ncbi:MAG: hypothetical protein FWG74_07440 [Planctomycetes bacterium]|nr:hypothetical protein [Planctomycetota bacterium]